MRNELTSLTAAQLSAALRARELSAVEAADAYLAAIEQSDDEVGAYLTVTSDRARAQAERADALLAAGEAPSPLTGVPMALKDNMCTRDVRTTCASRMLAHYTPTYDAHVTALLQAAAAPMLGKLNMDEFAMGSTTEHSAFHVTRNPRNLAYVPGGSSGGSAAAVAACEAAFALGSDTGGSIRQPAAFCGVVGMKPTYGAVSRRGLIAFASSLDQIGPLTRDVRDSAMVLSAIAGHDPQDATSLPRDWGSFEDALTGDVRGMRVALPRQYFTEALAPAVRDGVLAAARALEGMGAHVEEISLPVLDAALPAYYIMSSAEASSNLARFDGVRYGTRASEYDSLDELYCRTRSEGFGAEVRRRILLGSFVLSAGYYDAYYRKALQARTLLLRGFADVFSHFDLILCPVAPTAAWKIGEKGSDPTEMYLGDVCTVPVNLAGLPALSLPYGVDGARLPTAVQLVGPHFGERAIYRAAYALEQHQKEVRA